MSLIFGDPMLHNYKVVFNGKTTCRITCKNLNLIQQLNLLLLLFEDTTLVLCDHAFSWAKTCFTST